MVRSGKAQRAGLTLALLLVLGLWALAPASAATEITIMTHWTAENLRVMDPIIERYEALHPDVDVTIMPVTFNQLLARIMAGAISGSRPDIYHIYNQWLPALVHNGILAEPPAAVDKSIKEAFSQSAVADTTIDGVLWGYPTEVNTYGLVYNREMLAEAGFDRPPATWEELKEYADALTIRDERGKVIRAGFASWPGDVSGVVHPFYSLLVANGGQILDDSLTRAAFDSPEGVEALEFYASLVATPALAAYPDLPNEHVAMAIFAGWGRLNFVEIMGEERFEELLGTAPIPAGPNGSTSVSYGWSFVVDGASRDQQAVWEFLEWLNEPSGGALTSPMGGYLADALGAIPGGSADIEHHDVLATEYMAPYIEALDTAFPEPKVEQMPEINKILQAEIEAVFAGSKSAERALHDAANKVNAIL